MNVENLEKLFSPSQWSKRYGSDEVMQKHVDLMKKETQNCMRTIDYRENIPYGPLDGQVMDYYGLDLPTDAPLFVYIHGGYWQEECIGRGTSGFIAKQLYKNKCKTAIIGYNLCPSVELNQIIAETQDAFLRCIERAKADKSKGVYLVGHSAGAHLIMMFYHHMYNILKPEDWKLVKSVFLLGGIYDLEPLLHTSYNQPLKLNEKTAKLFSPLHQKLESRGNVKVYVVAAEYDSPAFIEQSEKLYKKLINSSFNAEYVLIKNVDHFNLIERLTEEDYELTKLLLQVEK